MVKNTFIKRAFDEVGGQAAMARALGLPFTTVGNWKMLCLPAEHVLAVARAAEWVVTPHQIAPQWYPNPFDGLPADVVAQCRALGAVDLSAIAAEKAPA